MSEVTMQNSLSVQIQQSNLSSDMAELLKNSFLPFQEQADQWMEKAKIINVTSIEQTADMKKARDARLALKDIRVAVEKKRKELKDESLRTGQAIDKVAKTLKEMIEPIEAHLQEQEDFAAVQEGKRIAALQVERIELVRPYVDELALLTMTNLGAMPDSQFMALLSGYKANREAAIAEAKRIEDERIAAEKKDAEEREAQRLENERLKKENEAKEKQLAEERKAAEAERKRLFDEAEKERAAALAEQKRIQDEADKEAKKQREESEKERKRIQAEADAKLKAEREAKAKIEAELKATQDAENKRLAEEEKARKEQEAAEKKAKRAPDKQKIISYAQAIRNIETPETKSEETQAILNEGSAMIMKAVKFLMEKANSL